MRIEVYPYLLKIAETEAEIKSAQHLRYKVFVEEMGAMAVDQSGSDRFETDDFDRLFKHIILIDQRQLNSIEQVVGVYRVMTNSEALLGAGFYSNTEFDLSRLEGSKKRLLELGRSCIHKAHRGGTALRLLWMGLAQHIARNQTQILFGPTSFPGIDPDKIENCLSYLHHYHAAPYHLRARARSDSFVKMNRIPKQHVDRRLAVSQLPPLLKAYLRLGAKVGAGAWLDRSFNTIDVCVVLDVDRMPPSQKMRFSENMLLQ